MKRTSRAYASHFFVGVLTALSGLILIGCDKSAIADGQYV